MPLLQLSIPYCVGCKRAHQDRGSFAVPLQTQSVCSLPELKGSSDVVRREDVKKSSSPMLSQCRCIFRHAKTAAEDETAQPSLF